MPPPHSQTQTPTGEVHAELRSDFRSEFETLLTALSTRFINLPVSEIDQGLVEALRRVGEYTGVDRSFVYQYVDRKTGLIELTHEWSADGAPPIPAPLRRYHLGPQRWLESQLSAGQIVHIPDTSDLPPEAADLSQVYQQVGVGSTINVPMFDGDTFVGTLGFSCFGRTKVWSDESISLLRVVGEIVVNAIDRKQKDRQLQRSEELYRSMVEDQIDFVVRISPDGTHTFVNEAVCKHLGKSPEELYRTTIYDFIHPDDHEEVRHKLAALTPEAPVSNDQHRVQLPSGEVYWHEWIDRALFDSHGQIQEYQSVGRDITERKLAEQELEYRLHLEKLSLSLSTQFINLPPDQITARLEDAMRSVGEFTQVDRSYIYLFDDKGETSVLAHEWCREGFQPLSEPLRRLVIEDHPWAVTLLEKGEIIHIPNLDTLPPGTDELRQLLVEDQIESFVLVPMLREGELTGHLGFSMSRSDQSWSEESVGLLQILGEVFVNALLRKETEQALSVSEERMRLTVDAVTDGFFDWNIATGDLFVSDVWLTARKHPLGNNHRHIDLWRSAVHPDCIDNVEAVLQAHLTGKTDFYSCEYRTRDGDGTWRWSLGLGRVVERDEHGNPLRMVGVDRDVTVEVTNRERLAETESQMAHLARVATMGEIVAGIAHEVNQPLHAAATFATACSSALESGDPEGPQRAAKMVRKISAQMTRAASIIKRLREFTRPQSVQMNRFDINGLIRESAELLAYEARKRQLRVAFDLDASIPLVMGDRVRIQQVVVNLIRNAYESVELVDLDNAAITLKSRLIDEGAKVEVVDNGAGLPEGEKIESLFDAFATTKSNGMGMGLAISRTIIQNHHGRIWGQPNLAGGMTFGFVLPIKTPSPH